MEHPTDPLKYVAYYRVSTARQGPSGLSLSAQRTGVAFIFTLRDSGVSFVCADMPEANTLTIGVMATMA